MLTHAQKRHSLRSSGRIQAGHTSQIPPESLLPSLEELGLQDGEITLKESPPEPGRAAGEEGFVSF